MRCIYALCFSVLLDLVLVAGNVHAQNFVGSAATRTGVIDTRSVSRLDQNKGREGTVEVFTNSAILLTNVRDARVYLLDGLEQISSELSAGLPANEQAAQQIVQQRLTRIGAAALQQRTKGAAEGIVRAANYGVDRVPAVVFDGHAVVYGERDIDVARVQYRRQAERVVGRSR
jgi:integrating conjugative element protein (TIGR03757 family)